MPDPPDVPRPALGGSSEFADRLRALRSDAGTDGTRIPDCTLNLTRGLFRQIISMVASALTLR